MRKLFRLFLPLLAVLFASAPAQARSFRTVVIDPGHGGHDKGGQWGLVYEKHLALDTSIRLENELKKRGFRTVLTRRSDYFISLPERVRIAMEQPPGLATGDIGGVLARVVDLTFQGPVLRLSLVAADGSPILAHVGSEQDLPLLRSGDEVYACWSPDASLVLPAGDTPNTRDREEIPDDS